MTMALTFNGITLSPVTYQNSLWIRATELARALGYSDTRKITHLYERNADEFTPEMTQVIEITDVPEMGTLENLRRKARIFSLRGCHLVAMFARTPVAKAFRKWVLDVLDKLDAEQHAASPSPTPDDFTGTLSITPCPTWAAMRIPCSARSACWTACSRAARKPSSASVRPWRTPACTCA